LDRRVNAKITFHSLLNLKSNASSSKQGLFAHASSGQHTTSMKNNIRVLGPFVVFMNSPRQPAAILAPFQHSMTNRELDVQASAPDPQALKIHFHP
jgi:hypothetical protein